MKVESLKVRRVKFIPDGLEFGVLYYSEEFGTAIHLCACGECCEQTVTPINPEYGWALTIVDDRPTLTPSIGNFQMPCKSHYHVTDGEIVWC